MKKRILSLILTLTILLSAVPAFSITVNSAGTSLTVSKEINWTPGSDTAEIVITSDVPEKNETQVLFLGTLCRAHSMEDGTIRTSLNAIAKNADVRYYLLNENTTSVTGDYSGSIKRGDTMTGSYTTKDKSNHASLQGFINILYNELITNGNGYDSTKDTRVDYIVLEFDASRLADSYSGTSTDTKLNTLAKELKKYYDDNKVIWITDGRLWNGKTSGTIYTETDGYTPANYFLKREDSEVSYLTADQFRSLCGIVAPSYYLAHTTADKTYYGNGSSKTISLSDYSLKTITRTGGVIDTSSYNAARQLTYKIASDLAEFLYMVIPGVSLEFDDKINLSDKISVSSVNVYVTTESTVTSSTVWTPRASLTVSGATVKTDGSGVKYVEGTGTDTKITVTTGNSDSTKNNVVSISADDLKGTSISAQLKFIKVVISLYSSNQFSDVITLKTDSHGDPILDAYGNLQYEMNPNNGAAEVSAYSGDGSSAATAIATGTGTATAPAVIVREISSKVTGGTKSQTGGDIKAGEDTNNPYTVYSANYKTVTTTYTPNEGNTLDTITVDGTVYNADSFKSVKTLSGTGYTVTLNADGSLDVVFASLEADHTVVTVFKSAMTISKASDKAAAKPGDTVTYTITVTNPTAAAASGIKITDALDSNLTYVSSSDGGSCSGGTVTWTGLTVPASGTKSVTVTVTVNSAISSSTDIKNIAVIKDSSDNELAKTPENSVNATPGTMTVTGTDVSCAYDGATRGTAATCTEADATLSYSTDGGATWKSAYPTIKDAGLINVKVKAEKTGYTTVYDDYTLEVSPRALTVTTYGDTKTYDGSAITKDGAVSGLITGDTITFATTGSQTDAGSSKNTYTITWDGTANKNNYLIITENLGDLTVTQRAVNLYSKSAAKVYDGTALTSPTVYADGSFSSTAIDSVFASEVSDIKATGTITNASSSKVTNTITYTTGAKFKASNYVINKTEGKLEVTKRSVTLTSATDTKAYDGTPLTNSAVSVSGDGFVTGEGATYNVTGTQTALGSSANAFTYTLTGTTKAGNYNISTAEGTLTVTPNTSVIVITADSATKKYDGTALTKNTYTYTSGVLASGDVLTAVVEGTITDAGTAANTVTSYKVMRGSVDVTSSYTFGPSVNGTLTVTKRSVTLTSATDTKAYDGKPLTNSNATAEGFVEGEGVTFTFTGSQTEVGSSSNTFTFEFNAGTKAGNYTVTPVYGKLTVSKNSNVIVITANSAEKVYDGKALKDDGYTYTQGVLADGDILVVTVEGTITDVGTAVNKVVSYKVLRPVKTASSAGMMMMALLSIPQDVTDSYTFAEPVDGTLKITPRTITLYSETAEKQYDGKALTRPDVYADSAKNPVDSVFASEVKALKATGSATNTADGTVANTITYTGKSGFRAENYDITKVEGTLRVTPGELTVIGSDFNGTYDGKPHGEIAVTNVPEGTTITYSIDGGITWTTEFPQITEIGTIKVIVKAENPNYKTATFEYILKLSQPAPSPDTGDNTAVTVSALAAGMVLSAILAHWAYRKKTNYDA